MGVHSVAHNPQPVGSEGRLWLSRSRGPCFCTANQLRSDEALSGAMAFGVRLQGQGKPKKCSHHQPGCGRQADLG